MPHQKRHLEPGSTYHVGQVSVPELRAFAEPAVREFYRERLAFLAKEESVRVLTLGLMDTHVHLQLWVPRSLSTFMQRLNTGFASYYNRRHNRSGPVLGEVFWCRQIISAPQFLFTSRYILLNPVDARIVRSLDSLLTSKRTNYPELMGRPGLFEADALVTLARFAPTPERARRVLREFLALGNENFDPEKYEDAPGPHGDSRSASPAFHEFLDREALVRSRRESGWSIPGLVRGVCTRMGVTTEALLSGTREPPVPSARAVVAYLAKKELGFALVEIAAALRIAHSAAHKAAERGETIAQRLEITIESLALDRIASRTR